METMIRIFEGLALVLPIIVKDIIITGVVIFIPAFLLAKLWLYNEKSFFKRMKEYQEEEEKEAQHQSQPKSTSTEAEYQRWKAEREQREC